MNFISRIDENSKIVLINVIYSFGIKGLSLILALFTMPVYMNFFQDKIILGLWFTILSILNWVMMFDMGLGNGLRNQLPLLLVQKDYSKAQKYISSTYFSTLIIVFLLICGSILIFPKMNWNSILNVNEELVSNKILIKTVLIVFMGIMIQFVLKLITSILYAIQKSAMVNTINLVTSTLIILLISIVPSKSVEENIIAIAWINVIAINLPLFILTIILFTKSLKNIYPKLSMFKKKYAVEVMRIGVTLLWLQIVFMIISSTNEFLISYFTSPEYVVEYQAYYKIFNTIASLFTIFLVPIWSAVTKAQVEKNYKWIEKMYQNLLILFIFSLLLELSIVPFLQIIMNTWLGNEIIIVNPGYAVIFALSSGIFILHNINTSVGNGLSYFKIQMIWMTIAAIVNIPLAYIFVNITGGWIGIIIANIIALMPYEIISPIYTLKYIRKQKCNS